MEQEEPEGPATVCAYVAPVEGIDAATQRRRLMTWSRRERVDVIGACEDAHRSGRHRPGLRQALRLVHAGECEGVVVLTERVISDDPIERASYAWVVSRAHGRLLVAEPEPVDNVTAIIRESDAQRRTWLQRLSSDAKLAAKQQEPDLYIGGRVAFGQKVQGGRLVADAENMAVVARILELRRVGMSYKGVADTLMAEGYKTALGRDTWYPASVKRVCDRYESAPDVVQLSNAAE